MPFSCVSVGVPMVDSFGMVIPRLKHSLAFDIGQLPQVQAWLNEQNYPIDENTLLIRRQLANQMARFVARHG